MFFMFISIAFGGAETPPDAATRGVARQGGSRGGGERGVVHSHKLRKERTSELNAFEMENENYEKCQGWREWQRLGGRYWKIIINTN